VWHNRIGTDYAPTKRAERFISVRSRDYEHNDTPLARHQIGKANESD